MHEIFAYALFFAQKASQASPQASQVCEIDPNLFWKLMFYLGRAVLINVVFGMLSQWFFRM